MSDTTTQLPENIQAAKNDHEAKKQAFIDSREVFKSVLAKADKHHKTAQAAHNESEQAGQKWRELLRHTEGAVNKEINALRHKETESKELALEFEKIALEVIELAKQNEKEAYDAYLEHGKAYHLVTTLYDDAVTQTAIRELLALPQAKILAWHLQQMTHNNLSEVVRMYGRDDLAQGQKNYQSMANNQTADTLLSMFLKLIDGLPSSEGYDDFRKGLTLAELSPVDASKFKPKTVTQLHRERYGDNWR